MLVSGETRQRRPQALGDDTVAEFEAILEALEPFTASACREPLAAAKQALAARFHAAETVEALVAAHAGLIDALLRRLWRHCHVNASEIALIAVGGYGRGELHPGSDIDVMLLLADDHSDTGPAAEFVTALWDSGLEVGHSVRTVEQCREAAADDVTVATTLMEARLLEGPDALFEAMGAATGPASIWPSTEFFRAKRDEQIARHRRYDDTGYKLEPNVKGSPGGLRDIQMIGWVAKRHFGAESFGELVDHGFLTQGQHQRLVECQHFLWTVRYGLHTLVGRREDRLLFDHQKSLAELLGYEDARFTLGVEQMMQRYYRTVMELSRLNEMLLQRFEEDILLPQDAEPVPIDHQFVSDNGYLQVVHDDVFARNPSALLALFRCMQDHPDLRGVSARTLGLVRRSLHLIDEQFRQHPRNHRLFLDLLRAPSGVTRELRRMNRYGVLGLYIPAFGRIVGRMQYDLFHAYTVDEHTLFVVSNMRRFTSPRHESEFPHCTAVMKSIEDQALIVLSGLFHDIAKGRGGDHSELGAIDALAFCREHGLPEEDAQLVSWLVEHHLVLSMTAQKKDLSDPDVIARFANLVGDKRRLDHLYLLTVADVRGTNPAMWTSWKSKLFRDLYEATRQALERGLENPLERQALIDATREAARATLGVSVNDAELETVWRALPGDYFLRHDADEIAWHTRALARDGLETSQLDVVARTDASGLAIMLYTPHTQHTFAAVTAGLDELGLSVLDARIEPINNGYSLDTYIVVDFDGADINDEKLTDVYERLLPIAERREDVIPSVSRKASRRQRMFDTLTRITFRPDPTGRFTVMELTCADHPGLLMRVGETLIDCKVYIVMAKIVTIGERAEDVFYLTDESDEPLSDADCDALREALLQGVDESLVVSQTIRV
ncbi:MAG: [protein-PII] uridylyltransferase [Pseudomonadota bacterium]